MANTNAQKWLNEKYPNKEETTEIYINEKELEGELDFNDFTKLEKIYISHFYIDGNDEIKLEIKDKEKYEEGKIIKLVSAQEHLNRLYPEDFKEERTQVEKLGLSSQNLEGNLDLSDFTDLEELTITNNPYLGEIKNVNPEAIVIRWNNIQEWFDKQYSNKEEKTIDFAKLGTDLKKLKFSKLGELKIEKFSKLTEIKKGDRNFRGVEKITIADCPELEKININFFRDNEGLNLEGDFPKLTELYCSSNSITNLDVSKCPELKKLYCHDNLLINITLPADTNKLEELALNNNNFKQPAIAFDYLESQAEKAGFFSYGRKLSFLKNYTKLKKLYLGNYTDHEDDYLKNYDETKKEKGIYNHFYGSLKYLKKLEELEILDISNTDITDIDLGLASADDWKSKYSLRKKVVIESIKEIYCSSKERPGSKVREIESKLKKDDSTFAHLSNRYIKKIEAQNWLKQSYPEGDDTCKNEYDKDNKNKKRLDIEKLNIKEWGLTGELDLSGFENLKELDCSNNEISKLFLNKNPRLIKINCSANKLAEIDFSNNKKLTNLDCNNNQLKSLDLKELKNLKELSCSDNVLNDFSSLALNVDNLVSLNISNNKFPWSRLRVFKEFTNLEKLYLGNTKKGKDNQFYGSLRYLENLIKLEELDISNTDIDSGLELLPESFQKLHCDPKSERRSARFAQVFSKYLTHESDSEYYDIFWWKKDKKNLLTRSDDIQKDIRRVFDRRRHEDVDNLEDPKELRKEGNKIDKVRSVGRGVSITTGALSFAGGALSYNSLSLVGGGIAVIYPLVEMRFVEEWEKEYTDKKEKWEEFAKDTKRLWHDYQDLVDILRPFKVYKNLSDENDKNLNNLWQEFEKVLENENNIKITKEQFDKELKEKWKKKKWEWKGIEGKLVEITGKIAESEDSNNQQQVINSKGKGKETDNLETDALIEIVVDRIRQSYGSMSSSNK